LQWQKLNGKRFPLFAKQKCRYLRQGKLWDGCRATETFKSRFLVRQKSGVRLFFVSNWYTKSAVFEKNIAKMFNM
jgi:hypothetical protein